MEQQLLTPAAEVPPTAEQLARAEANRQRALAIRAKKAAEEDAAKPAEPPPLPLLCPACGEALVLPDSQPYVPPPSNYICRGLLGCRHHVTVAAARTALAGLSARWPPELAALRAVTSVEATSPLVCVVRVNAAFWRPPTGAVLSTAPPPAVCARLLAAILGPALWSQSLGVTGLDTPPGHPPPSGAATNRHGWVGASFPLAVAEQLESSLGRCWPIAVLPHRHRIPRPTLSHLQEAPRVSRHDAASALAALPRRLREALLPFQAEGVLYGLSRGGRCLIADEMGVGKTLQAIALAACYRDEWPLLIVVPASLRLPWAEELEKWLPATLLRPSGIHVVFASSDKHRLPPPCPKLVARAEADAARRAAKAAHKAGGHTAAAVVGPGGGAGGGAMVGGATSTSPTAAISPSAAPAAAAPAPPPPQVVIISYRMAVLLRHTLACIPWAVVIADESHTLRTSPSADDSAQTEVVARLVAAARRAILVTGTPALSRPFDIYRQVAALRPGLLGNREAFATAYCGDRRPTSGSRDGWVVCGGRRLGELHALLSHAIMIRRLKANVLAQLPPKRRCIVRLCLAAGDAEIGGGGGKRTKGKRRRGEDAAGAIGHSNVESPDDAAAGGVGGDDDDDLTLEEAAAVAACATQAPPSAVTPSPPPAPRCSADHALGRRKVGPAVAWLSDALHLGGPSSRGQVSSSSRDDDTCSDDPASTQPPPSDPKVLIFAHHIDVMAGLARGALSTLDDASDGGPGYVIVDGSTDALDRVHAVRRFQTVAGVCAALVSITAGNTGLDFSAASCVVFVELPAEVSALNQAEDRAHRRGTTGPVTIYYLLAGGTVDESRWRVLCRSQDRLRHVHDGADTAGTGIPVAAIADQGGGSGDSDSDGEGGEGAGARRWVRSRPWGTQAAAPPPDTPPPAPAPALAGPPACAPSQSTWSVPDGLWFEVSPHTGRMYLHAASDGSRPLDGAAFLPEQLDLATALGDPTSGVGLGVSLTLVGASAAAATFLAQWRARTPLERLTLQRAIIKTGRPHELPLAEAIEAATAVAGMRAPRRAVAGSPLPPRSIAPGELIHVPTGAELRTVAVRGWAPGGGILVATRQRPYDVATGRPLCVLCGGGLPHTAVAPDNTICPGDMLCSADCDRAWSRLTSPSSLRRELFALERGVCRTCGLDCHGLVKRCAVLKRDARAAAIVAAAPAFGGRGNAALLARLVQSGCAGHAWQADHIIPVAEGGGLCDLSNMRTLCVICHKAETAALAARMAADRARSKAAAIAAAKRDASVAKALAPRGAKARGTAAAVAAAKVAANSRVTATAMAGDESTSPAAAPPPLESFAFDSGGRGVVSGADAPAPAVAPRAKRPLLLTSSPPPPPPQTAAGPSEGVAPLVCVDGAEGSKRPRPDSAGAAVRV